MRLRHSLQVALILAVSGAMLGFAASFLISRRYVARATLAVVSNELFTQAARLTVSDESLVPLILQNPAYKARLDLTPISGLIQKIREDCVVRTGLARNAATFEFTDDDRFLARETAQILLSRMTGKAAGARIAGAIHVTETGPTRALFSAIGLSLGLLIAAVLLWLQSRPQTASR